MEGSNSGVDVGNINGNNNNTEENKAFKEYQEIQQEIYDEREALVLNQGLSGEEADKVIEDKYGEKLNKIQEEINNNKLENDKPNFNIENFKKAKITELRKKLKDFAKSNYVKDFHKNQNLEFKSKPEADVKVQEHFYFSHGIAKRQSTYSLALDKKGNLYYVREADH